ncbi:PaaI family thioesterase [Sandaracinobacter sp. RS1-74]|uniref:PaaI family thioesterase n=1 Tax=Sandaracinobacteroides sayramensis TaxID=2913411 RepID=UPI001EDB9794|nr:PaaI family thioesterase [Sandaracinobacteroides sayramensis]MCG2840093.1 PaaI family thioesterase [Sandaracinobacteroides sayramensis]
MSAGAIAQLPPYAAMLDLRIGENVVTMPFSPHLIGSPGRLHGGSVAGLMEIAANIKVRAALENEPATIKPINVTVDYLREGAMEDSHAEAFIMRIGRRVANVRVEAWQGDRGRLIAAARMNLLIAREAPQKAT